MSGILEQAKAAAASTASNVAQLATTAANVVQSQAAAVASHPQVQAVANHPQTQAAGTLLSQAGSAVASAATTAQQQVHNVAPGFVPAPGGVAGGVIGGAGVDKSHDLKPSSPLEKSQLESMLSHRPDPKELQDKGILKGAPGDTLAGKKAELERAQLSDKLDGALQNRPAASELVKEGILTPSEAPPTK